MVELHIIILSLSRAFLNAQSPLFLIKTIKKPSSLNTNYFLLIPVAIFSILSIPQALTIGMFFDGITFAAISRNMAEGFGNFFAPYYTQTLFPRFFEYPALAFFIQSVFFKFFGDNIFIDKLQSIFLGFFTLLISMLFWKKYTQDFKPAASSWFASTLWLITPITMYVINNNLLENSLLLFSLLSLTSMLYENYFAKIISGLFLFLSFLVKGPPALFIISLPFIFFIFTKEKKHLITFFVTCLVFFTLLLFMFFFIRDGRVQLYIFLNRQVIKSFAEYRVVQSHFFLLKEFFQQIKFPFLITFIAWVIMKCPKLNLDIRSLTLFIVGLVGFFPFLLSLKQYDRYLFPSLFFITTSIALVFINTTIGVERALIKPNSQKIVVLLSVFLIAFSLISMFFNRGRVINQKQYHSDFKTQSLQFLKRRLITVCPSSLTEDWELVASVQRYLKASLSKDPDNKYLLVKKASKCFVGNSCKIISPESRYYVLYRCRDYN